MLIKQTTLSLIKTLGIITIILLIVLFIFEIQAYYFPDGRIQNQDIYNKLFNRNANKSKEDKFINIYQDTEFENIFEYLKQEDAGYEDKFPNNDDTLGCYDNDILMEDIKGDGQTCKAVAPTVFNIFEKNLNHSNGTSYSFADICPVTSGQERPIMCLYKKGSHINNINKKMANLIDQIQLDQGMLLNNLENSMTTHIVDPNRLFNQSQIKEYNRYENNLNMGLERRFTNEDQLDDLVLFSKRLQSNLA